MDALLIGVLIFVAVTAFGGAFVLVQTARRAPLRARLERLHASGTLVNGLPAEPRSRGWLHRLGRAVSGRGPSAALQQELTKAGIHAREAAVAYLGVKVLLLVLGVSGATLLLWPMTLTMPVRLLLAVACGVLVSFMPNLVLRHRRRQRQHEMQRCLPDAIDLLEICVLSGMGLDAAWNAVSEEIRRVSPTLADEMALTNLEMHLGATRSQAHHNMAERTGATDVASLATVLTHSERFGTSVADALTAVASSMRQRRSQRAEEIAERMAVKLLIPMILFIFPCMLMVVVGPAGLTLARLMQGD